MSKSAFDQFLLSRTQPVSSDWEARKEQWLQAVDGLYAQVEGWLDEYIQALAVVCEREPRELVEDSLGRYRIDALKIGCQGIDVILDPIGANILGAYGRVDLAGPAGSLRLLLVSAGSGGPRVRNDRASDKVAEARPVQEPSPAAAPVFKLATDPPAVKYLDLDQELFLDALMYVMGARIQPPGE